MNTSVPQHVAIIMDGNGRWAQQRGKIRTEGHRAGAKRLPKVVEALMAAGVKTLTVYAFSTENWKRPEAEVSFLMGLIPRFCKEQTEFAHKHGIRLRVMGRMKGLPKAAQDALKKAMEETKDESNFTLVLALNYGGRAEILDAVNALLTDKSCSGEVTEEVFRKYLYAPDIPDPDLMIRTGGEKRLSNFLLWELSYAELYVTDALWPDFDETELQKALDAYANRDRRYGGIKGGKE